MSAKNSSDTFHFTSGQSNGEETHRQVLKSKKRGVYAWVVEVYSDVITPMAITLALDIITEDLEKESGAKVELNYFSLAQTVKI